MKTLEVWEEEKIIRRKINCMSYRELLLILRFVPKEHVVFKGELGEHFKKTLREKRNALTPLKAARIAKSIGFGVKNNTEN